MSEKIIRRFMEHHSYTPPKILRSAAEIQFAHNILIAVLMTEIPVPLVDESTERDLTIAVDTLCWILGHDHNPQMNHNLKNFVSIAIGLGAAPRRDGLPPEILQYYDLEAPAVMTEVVEFGGVLRQLVESLVRIRELDKATALIDPLADYRNLTENLALAMESAGLFMPPPAEELPTEFKILPLEELDKDSDCG